MFWAIASEASNSALVRSVLLNASLREGDSPIICHCAWIMLLLVSSLSMASAPITSAGWLPIYPTIWPLGLFSVTERFIRSLFLLINKSNVVVSWPTSTELSAVV